MKGFEATKRNVFCAGATVLLSIGSAAARRVTVAQKQNATSSRSMHSQILTVREVSPKRACQRSRLARSRFLYQLLLHG